MASGGIDGSVVIWSVVTGLQLHLLNLHTAAIRTLSFDTGAWACIGLWAFGGGGRSNAIYS